VRIAPSGWLPEAQPDADALFKEARRRQRRRWITTGVVIAVLLGGAASGDAGADPAQHRHHAADVASRVSGVRAFGRARGRRR